MVSIRCVWPADKFSFFNNCKWPSITVRGVRKSCEILTMDSFKYISCRNVLAMDCLCFSLYWFNTAASCSISLSTREMFLYSICVQMAMAFPINLPICRGRSRGKDNAQSLHSEQAGRIPRACCRAASPALPAVPGCCRTHPQWWCSRWQGWCMTFANVAMAKPL